MQEQLILFELSNKCAVVYCLYLHNPLRFNSCRILLLDVGGCDNASMFIMICFVTGCVMLLLADAWL